MKFISAKYALIICSALLLKPFGALGQPKLIPFPVKYSATEEVCPFNSLSLQNKSNDGRIAAEFFDVCSMYGMPTTKKGKNMVVKLVKPSSTITEESYTLDVNKQGVTIAANGFKGYFNAFQTLKQLIVKNKNGYQIACCRIEDQPAFGMRGFMLDVGRNYLDVELIKDMARRLSRYKMNTLHLHLTDNPGWRVEVTKYPQLTESKNFWATRLPGKFYTQNELREIVAYCDSLNIEVIPEIDMPGHSASFKKAMGVDMQSEEGLNYLKNIMDEVVPLFPSRYFHVGADEVKITMKNFMPDIIQHIRSKGKEVIGWHPGNLPDSMVVRMCWGKNEHATALDKKHRYIDSNGFYLEWVDSQSGVLQTFFQQPCEVPQGDDHALGAIMCVWGDAAVVVPERVLAQYPFYPCAITFAERVWRGLAYRKEEYMAKLPPKGSPEWRDFADFESRLTTHRDLWFKDVPFAYVRQADMEWRLIGPFDHKGVNDTSFAPEKEICEQYITADSDTLRWANTISYGGFVHIRHLYTMFQMRRQQYYKGWPTVMSEAVGTGNGTCYALTYITSPIEQDVYLMSGINGMWGHTGGQRTSRSPEQGSWDYNGGDMWLNDRRLDPPKWNFESLPWTGWGEHSRTEIPLTEEGYFFRPPIKIHLNKGQNKILVRSAFGGWKGETGEIKWFFCCMPVNWDGKHYTEVEGLSYSAFK